LPETGKRTGVIKTLLQWRLIPASFALISLLAAAFLVTSIDQPFQQPVPAVQTTATEATINTGSQGDVTVHTHDYAGDLIILNKNQQGRLTLMSDVEKNLLLGFAEEQNLRPVWRSYQTTADLFQYLDNNADNIIITSPDNPEIEFDDPIKYTLPWGISSQQVVVRSGSQQLSSITDLATRQVAIKKSSPAWPELRDLADKNPGMDLQVIPEQASTDTVLTRVTSGYYDMAVLDNFSLEKRLPEFLGLEIALTLGGERIMSWAVKSASGSLHQSLNVFLYKNHLKLNLARIYKGDLPALQKRKVLRLITYQNPVNYYLDNGKLKGFEYELLERFAKNHGMRLGVVVANSHTEMAQMLIKGQGDVVAASLPRGSFTSAAGIAYTRSYGFSTPVVIGRSLDYPLLDSRDLAGRRIVLPAESPYRSLLKRLRTSGLNFELVQAGAGLNTAATLYRVSQGEYDLTVIGSNQVNSEFEGHLNLKSHFALSEPTPEAWVVRADATMLLKALNDYIEKEYRKGFYNVLLAKYIENPAKFGNRNLMSDISRLSPYDDLVHKYAEQYGFDWRLIVAQMYQESHFNPDAVSYAGAEGLMQLTPDTGDLLGIKDLNDPDASIYGGIKYMSYLRGRFEDDLLMEDRTWFTLAAYNAGYNRVKRARWLAERMGLDKNKWFDNVERAMVALARPYRKDGELVQYCRCGQTAHYIRDIRTLYNNYVRLTQSVRLAADMITADKDS